MGRDQLGRDRPRGGGRGELMRLRTWGGDVIETRDYPRAIRLWLLWAWVRSWVRRLLTAR
jgi:hypothetical protein